MTKLHNYKDGKTGCFANILMDDGDPCFISVAHTKVLVKKSNIGMLGEMLFQENEVYKAGNTAKALKFLYPERLTPDGITNPVLNAFTNAVLHCSNLGEVTRVLNEAVSDAETQSGQPIADLEVIPD
jgi:hypothetical protein